MTNPYSQIVQRYIAQGKLASAHLDLTYRCDLDCVHCYLDDRTKPGPDTETWLRVIDELAAIDCFSVTLSGGEVFIRKDIWEILGRLQEHRFYVRVKTHGRRIRPEIAKKLKDYGVHAVDLSIYSLTPEPHNKIVQRRGAHEDSMKAIEYLLEHDISVKVNNVVMPQNFGEHRELHAVLSEKGVTSIYEGTIRGFQGGGTEVYDVGLCLPDLVQLESDRIQDAGRKQRTGLPVLSESQQCGAGVFSLYVDPEGDVTPCVAWPMAIGNIREQSIGEIWGQSSKLDEIRDIRQSDREGCNGCSYRSNCSYCPGMAYIESGSPTEPATTLCRTAQARSVALKQTALEGQQRPFFFPIAKNKTNAENARDLEALLSDTSEELDTSIKNAETKRKTA